MGERDAIEAPEREKLGMAGRAWCALMLLVMVASAAVLGAFLTRELKPESAALVRIDLAKVTPQPGFDI
ncbi:hypothetical protein [Aurantiacibacter odishensis]|uniref:hypothetical protein n=1 Tax=Aurantiacibacter odishensis TaxID=1155476 RepID=UPI000E72FE23|nr:hypothetical protein [Aurantiacibacter odishensis]